jgi:protein gp37
MGAKTKIDWCDSTWNPVTGCLHGCAYCYARKIAERFGGVDYEDELENRYGMYDVVRLHAEGDTHELDYPLVDAYSGKKAPYPFAFDPTFHRYKLDEPQCWKKPCAIFVCSMADLFGEWVPDEWIEQVFEACEATPQHRYLFLTKNPKRYVDLYGNGILRVRDSFWYGSTITGANEPFFFSQVPDDNPHTFCSIEPILEPVGTMQVMPDWVIVGAETSNRKGKVVPQKEWIDEIAAECKRRRKPLFMKDSLRGLMGDDFKQEFPWEVK